MSNHEPTNNGKMPKILYLDDEQYNLDVFEFALPNTWEIHTTTSPTKALSMVEALQPSVVISDQKMPDINGVEFLKVCKKISPMSARIIMTGYSEEDLVIRSVRDAQVYDYIRKPWNEDNLVASLMRAHEYSMICSDRENLLKELKSQNEKLVTLNEHEKLLNEELACWVHPIILDFMNDKGVVFPFKKNLACITFDIINGGKLHNVHVRGVPLRNILLEEFTRIILEYGGWRESQMGDSAYAHFGIFNLDVNACEIALSAALAFRQRIEALKRIHSIQVDCGISLHYAMDVVINLHSANIHTQRGNFTQKYLDSSSAEIDLLFRIEKKVHNLKGSNIITTRSFVNQLSDGVQFTPLGEIELKNIDNPVEVLLVPSDHLEEGDIINFKSSLNKREIKPSNQ